MNMVRSVQLNRNKMSGINTSGVAMTKQRTASIPIFRDESADALSGIAAHWRMTGELPPELVTGHRLIDFEHRFLVSSIANLRKVCIDHRRFRIAVVAGLNAGGLARTN